MAKIKIGETTMEACVRHAGDTLSLTFAKARIEEIASLLTETAAPEVRELTGDGQTKAIYKNHALTRVYTETTAGVPYVHAVLRTEILEQSEAEALKEQIASLQEQNEMLTACVLEMSETVYA